ncbi:MAG: PilN domain-containing protein [Candidatus Moranbacteria bacterium]|nr:PilN domain-containing protein [Candidatus Moranbacteria bacterium]
MKIEINLLPPNKKEALRVTEQFRAVLGWEGIVFFMAVLFFGFILGINYLLDFNLESVSASRNNESNGTQYETIKHYATKFLDVNSKISKVGSIASGQIYWSALFSKLNSEVPDNVEISGMATKNYGLSLAGKAKTREDLLLFKDNLEKEQCFENVNLPLSDLVSKEDIAFQIDLGIKENCIKNQ